mgnify:CR=1 FL=1
MIEVYLASLFSSIILISFGNFFVKKIKFASANYNYYENGLYGVIFLSFISLIINFFFPLNKIVGSTILVIGIVLFLIHFFSIQKKKGIIISIIISSLFTFLIISYSNINRPDAGLYHLPFNSILNENKIIVGLYNIHFRFAHTSIIQYLSGVYNNFFFINEFLTIPLATIVSLFLCRLIHNIRFFFKTSNLFNCNLNLLFFVISIISFNNYTNFGNDAPSHIYFFLITLIFFENIKNLFNNNDIFLKIFLISIFLLAQKPFMIVTGLLILVLFFNHINKIDILKDIRTYFIFFLFSSFLIKNVLISSCMIFPIEATCFKTLKIYDEKTILTESVNGEAWSKGWSDQTGDIKLNHNEYIKNFNWINTWFSKHFKKVLNELVPSLAFLIIFYLLYLILLDTEKRKYEFNKKYFLMFIFTSITVLIWFLKFPLFRFGESFLLQVLILTILFLLREKKVNQKKYKIFISCFVLLGLIGFVSKNLQRIYKNYDKNQIWPMIYTLKELKDNYPKKLKSFKDNENNLIYFYSSEECMYNSAPCSNYILKNIKLDTKKSYKVYYY